jgi:hypothetical protein
MRGFLRRVFILNKRHGKKTARVALAWQMLTIVNYMLLRNTPYKERQQG